MPGLKTVAILFLSPGLIIKKDQLIKVKSF